jgi:mRNA interferase RelE/StbE
LAGTIKYSDSARKQLYKLDRQSAMRILDDMDERILASSNPRANGKILTGPTLGSYWRYRVGSDRMICQIQDEVLCVLAIEIGSRKEIYL